MRKDAIAMQTHDQQCPNMQHQCKTQANNANKELLASWNNLTTRAQTCKQHSQTCSKFKQNANTTLTMTNT